LRLGFRVKLRYFPLSLQAPGRKQQFFSGSGRTNFYKFQTLNPGLRSEVLTSIAQLVLATALKDLGERRGELLAQTGARTELMMRHNASDGCAIAPPKKLSTCHQLCADFGRIDKVSRL